MEGDLYIPLQWSCAHSSSNQLQKAQAYTCTYMPHTRARTHTHTQTHTDTPAKSTTTLESLSRIFLLHTVLMAFKRYSTAPTATRPRMLHFSTIKGLALLHRQRKRKERRRKGRREGRDHVCTHSQPNCHAAWVQSTSRREVAARSL